MSSMENAFRSSRLNIMLAVIGFVLMTVSVTPPAGAQTTGVQEPDEPLTLEDFYLAPGELLASGVDKQASGPLQIKSYKVEQVKLPRPLKLGGSTEAKVVESVLRLTVTLGSPAHGAYMILLDDEPKTAVITQRNGVSAIFFSAGELEDGAQISVAHGTGCNRRLSSTMTSKLRLPEAYKLPQRGDADPGYGVKKLRSVPAPKGARDHRNEVEVRLTTPVAFPISNELLVMQVGDLEILGGGYGADPQTLIFRMSAEEFSRAEDGKRIKVKYGRCSGGGTRFGKLNKAQLDQ